MKVFALCLAVLFCAGCPKNAPVTVAGTDDEQLDMYSAQLEELHSRAKETDVACDKRCADASKTCDLSKKICDLAKRNADRNEMQSKCVGSQEDCAIGNDACAGCSR